MEERYVVSGGKRLKCGYTTGTCAALAAQGALRMLLTGKAPAAVSVVTPKGWTVEVEPEFCCFGTTQMCLEQTEPFQKDSEKLVPELQAAQAHLSYREVRNSSVTQKGSATQVDSAALCAIRKDSGDDPDITNGMLVVAEVSLELPPENLERESFTRCENAFKQEPSRQQTHGHASGNESVPDQECKEHESRSYTTPSVLIHGGEGVGRVTKPGLDQPVGEAAVNRVPREMIRQAVLDVLEEEEFRHPCTVHVTVSIPGGAERAQKTFNPKLGIEGGLSILGTSGIVEPMSEQALIDTIKVELRQAYMLGARDVILTPGNYGMDYLREQGLADAGVPIIKISNFVGDSLDETVALGFQNILLVGHIGKFVKLAADVWNTHSKYGDHRMDTIAAHAGQAGADERLCQEILQAATTDAALELLAQEELPAKGAQSLLFRTMQRILQSIQKNLGQRVRGAADSKPLIGVILFSNVFGTLGETEGATSLKEQFLRGAEENG